MDPIGKLSLQLLNSGFWGITYVICILGMALACWVGCYRIPQEMLVSKPAKIAAWLVLFSMCIVVVTVNSATPPRVKSAMAHTDLRELIWDWKRGDRAAVEKWLSDPEIQKYYANDDE
jgi:hypothetical protein